MIAVVSLFLFRPLATRVLLPVRIDLERLIDRYLAYLTLAKMHNRTGHQNIASSMP